MSCLGVNGWAKKNISRTISRYNYLAMVWYQMNCLSKIALSRIGRMQVIRCLKTTFGFSHGWETDAPIRKANTASIWYFHCPLWGWRYTPHQSDSKVTRWELLKCKVHVRTNTPHLAYITCDVHRLGTEIHKTSQEGCAGLCFAVICCIQDNV